MEDCSWPVLPGKACSTYPPTLVEKRVICIRKCRYKSPPRTPPPPPPFVTIYQLHPVWTGMRRMYFFKPRGRNPNPSRQNTIFMRIIGLQHPQPSHKESTLLPFTCRTAVVLHLNDDRKHRMSQNKTHGGDSEKRSPHPTRPPARLIRSRSITCRLSDQYLLLKSKPQLS